MLVAVLVILSMAFAPEIILIFGGRKYYEAIWVVPPVAVSMFLIFLYSLFSNIEYYFKKTGFIALASIVCAVANLGLNKVFIELFGYYAAGYTTLVCYGLLALMHYFFYRKALHQEGVRASEVYNLETIAAYSGSCSVRDVCDDLYIQAYCYSLCNCCSYSGCNVCKQKKNHRLAEEYQKFLMSW